MCSVGSSHHNYAARVSTASFATKAVPSLRCIRGIGESGNRGGRTNFRYDARNGQIYTGLTVISYNLQDVSPEDGGFSCIPGSHKSDFQLSEEERERLFAFGGPLVRTIPAPPSITSRARGGPATKR